MKLCNTCTLAMCCPFSSLNKGCKNHTTENRLKNKL